MLRNLNSFHRFTYLLFVSYLCTVVMLGNTYSLQKLNRNIKSLLRPLFPKNMSKFVIQIFYPIYFDQIIPPLILLFNFESLLTKVRVSLFCILSFYDFVTMTFYIHEIVLMSHIFSNLYSNEY